jgi:hypothetical protein
MFSSVCMRKDTANWEGIFILFNLRRQCPRYFIVSAVTCMEIWNYWVNYIIP